jgi:hypothetical protein
MDVKDERQSGWLKSLISRLFESDTREEEDLEGPRGDGSGSDREGATPGPPRSAKPSKAPKVADKLVALRNALELETEVESRLDRVSSSQDLLLYVYEVVLPRFASLKEIGLLGEKSAETIERLHDKLEALLVNPHVGAVEKQRLEMEALQGENATLKKQLTDLRAKYIKSGIISERETQLEKEGLYLKRRVIELTSMLKTAGKKVASLSAVHETNHGLRARNSLLTTKVAHQTRLLRSLTANQPQQQELLSAVDKLNEENKRLKEQFRKQAALVDDLQAQLSDDDPSRDVIRELTEENVRLRSEMDEGEEDLQGLDAGRPEETILDNLDRLQDENARIKTMLESKRSLFNAMQSGKTRESGADTIVEMMKKDNDRLKQIVLEKKEEIQVLSHKPSSEIMLKTIVRLRNENREMAKDLHLKAELCQQLENEKRELRNRPRDDSATTKQIKQIIGELEFSRKLIASLKKVELDYKELKKEHFQARSQLELAVWEKGEMSKKLARLTAEYELLIKEYESIFDKM